MEGAKNIKETILNEARKEAEKIREETRKEVEKVQKEQASEQEQISSRGKEQRDKKVSLLKDKTLAQARLHAKRALLIEREKIIEGFVIDAVEGIDHGSAAYGKFMKKLVSSNTKSLSGEITYYCSKKDLALVKKLVGEGTVEPTTISGGIIVENDAGKRIDESLTVHVERSEDKIRKTIAKEL